MKGCVRIIDLYLSKLLILKPSPYFKVLLDKLIKELKCYGYPAVELADIISICIILDYLLSDENLTKTYRHYIRKALFVINEILGDGLYIKIEPKIISIEQEFYKNIAPCEKQFSDRLSEEIRKLII
ncbi:MAG: hypothetical protein IJQ68_04145 [Methanobrevibacter sp.]|uniref:hypothetical protein n=1 Tax=Methanobrevibacter sp. TaxID=66852 RepID=UPI0025D26436|nr:hypothetical protein [Methanobrevibacter sp.]MBR0271168.1 hypothetical protein [Methanobrevibacter sp.]